MHPALRRRVSSYLRDPAVHAAVGAGLVSQVVLLPEALPEVGCEAAREAVAEGVHAAVAGAALQHRWQPGSSVSTCHWKAIQQNTIHRSSCYGMQQLTPLPLCADVLHLGCLYWPESSGSRTLRL